MEHTLPRDNQAPSGVKSWQLWFSLAAGIIVWIIHLMIVYPLTSLACEWGWISFSGTSLSGLQFVQIIATVIAGTITILAGYFAFRNWQRTEHDEDLENNRHRFMGQMGLALNILFTALIVVAIVPILTIPPC